MNELITATERAFGLVMVAAVLVFIGVCSGVSVLLRLREAIANAIARKEAFEAERRRLELIKLYYEIEAIKKANSLSSNLPDEYQTPALRGRYRFPKTEILVNPAILPRRFLDLLLWPASFFVIIVLMVLPSIGIAWIVLPSTGIAWATDNLGAAIMTSSALILIYASVLVRSLAVSDRGIRFVRIFGAPRFLPWENIVSITLVNNPFEVLFRGLLWPLFPPRESTISMTMFGQYKIVWRDGFCYFPPKNCQSFESLISKYLGRARPDNASIAAGGEGAT